ncbi:MAG: hypothetical protein ABJB61_00135 [bacterium]
MKFQGTHETDTSLAGFLEAATESDSDCFLAELISAYALPIVRKIIRSKLRVTLDPADGSYENQEALEIISDVQTTLVDELRRLKHGSDRKVISDFSGYVAVVTYHACYRYLRRKYPERWRLKNKLRYLLTHRQDFALWQGDEGDWCCGLSVWRNQSEKRKPLLSAQEMQETHPSIVIQPGEAIQPGRLTNVLTVVFQAADGPVSLDELVNVVADLWLIKSATAATAKQVIIDDRGASLVDQTVDVAKAVEQRIHLKELWREISELPFRHRSALLLNLRDAQGRGVITLLPIARIATIQQIARILEFPLGDFAKIWKELPWDDNAIAAHLGLTRQQVINLRHSARGRLLKLLKDY